MSRRKRDKRQSRRGVGAPPPAAPSTPADGTREVGRFSARRKTETMLRLLRGESLDGLARELGVTAATLAGWREAFLAGGQAGLKSRLPDERDDEIQRLRAKVGEITMNNELLLERCHRLEANLPLPRRRPSE
jgi:transposase